MQVGRAEEELRAEERQHNLDSYRYAMVRVTAQRASGLDCCCTSNAGLS